MSTKFSPKELKLRMTSARMTAKSLGYFAGVSKHTIYNYLHGNSRPNAQLWSNLLRVLRQWEVGLPLPIEYEFEAGRKYSIESVEVRKAGLIGMDPATGAKCVFSYQRKAGIHHCFVEVRGGWLRTYTDAQLIGKEIREVK